MRQYIGLDGLTADRTVSFDCMDHLRRAFEEFANTYHGQIKYMDAFMAVHNFHKLIVGAIADRMGLTGLERAEFLRMSVSTYEKAIETTIQKLAGQ